MTNITSNFNSMMKADIKKTYEKAGKKEIKENCCQDDEEKNKLLYF